MNTESLENITTNSKLKLKHLFNIQKEKIKNNKIRRVQKRLLKENYDPKSEKLIIFLVPAADIVQGGLLSISSIHDETKKIKNLKDTEVMLCTLPGQYLLKYTTFKNQNYIYEFSDVISYFQNLKSLMIHVPEIFSGPFLKNITKKDFEVLDKIEDLHVNILIQNIDLALDSLDDIKELSRKFPKITGTTAHENYTNPQMRELFGFPLHKFSTFVSPEQYNKRKYSEKEDLLLVSPDPHPQKSEVLKLFEKEFENLKIQIIENLSYEEFKDVISRAKWSLTFGEGLDGYFIEPVFSGSISFSVYNSEFFTKDFESFKTVYSDYNQLIKQMPKDIVELDNESGYSHYHEKLYDLCSKYYDYEEYKTNLELFYSGKYTYK